MRTAVLQMALVALALGSVPAAAQESRTVAPDTAMEARIWLDRGDDPVLQRGDRVRIYYRVNADAFVALFHIDTDGSVTLLYPRAPGEDNFVRADRDYRLLFPSSSYWYVDEYPGKGYFFMVASPLPLHFADYGYSSYDHQWDLTQVGQTVYTDPYVAMDDHVAHLIPDWKTVPYALDFTSYDVGREHEYPRFMCYQCHGYRSYTAWDPYSYGCSAVRVVIWDDPYYSSVNRYAGTRVVLERARFGVPRYQFEKRAPGASWMPVRRTRQPPSPGLHYLEPGAAAGQRPDASPPRRAVPRSAVHAPAEAPRRLVVPRDQGAPGARAGQGSQRSPRDVPLERRTNPTVAPPAATEQRPTLLRRPTSILAPSRRGGAGGADGGRENGGSATPRGETRTVSPPGGKPTATPRVTTPTSRFPPAASRGGASRTTPTRPTVKPNTPPRATTPPRPALRPRPKTGGGGGRPVVRPPRTGGGGGRPVARPSRTGGGGGRPVARPSRPGGGGRPVAAPRRGGGGTSSRVPVRRHGGGG